MSKWGFFITEEDVKIKGKRYLNRELTSKEILKVQENLRRILGSSEELIEEAIDLVFDEEESDQGQEKAVLGPF